MSSVCSPMDVFCTAPFSSDPATNELVGTFLALSFGFAAVFVLKERCCFAQAISRLATSQAKEADVAPCHTPVDNVPVDKVELLIGLASVGEVNTYIDDLASVDIDALLEKAIHEQEENVSNWLEGALAALDEHEES